MGSLQARILEWVAISFSNKDSRHWKKPLKQKATLLLFYNRESIKQIKEGKSYIVKTSSLWLVSYFSLPVMSDSLRPHELQHTRPLCPSPTPGAYSNSCPSSRWCHPAISSSVSPFSSCLQSLLASGSFPMGQLFAWGGQSIGVSASASVPPMNTQDWSPTQNFKCPALEEHNGTIWHTITQLWNY